MRVLVVFVLLLSFGGLSPTVLLGQQPPRTWSRRAPCWDYCSPEWKACRTISLRSAASTTSQVLGSVQLGDSLQATDGVLIIVRPGVVTFRSAYTYVKPGDWVEAQAVPVDVPDSLTFSRRDTLYIYDRDSDGDGQGVWRIWFRGQFYGVDQFWPFIGTDRSGITLVSEPSTQWWARVRTATGLEGWLEGTSENVAGRNPRDDDFAARCSATRRGT